MIEHFGEVDAVYDPAVVLAQSTSFYRTIQSAYAEMIGMFPELDQKFKLSPNQFDMLARLATDPETIPLSKKSKKREI